MAIQKQLKVSVTAEVNTRHTKVAHLYFVHVPGTANNPHTLLDQRPGHRCPDAHRGSGHQRHPALPALHVHRA